MPSKRCATLAKGKGNCSSAAETNRMACRSRCEIQVQASHQRILTACSRLSTARSPAVWGLGCRSAGRLSKRITDACGRALTCHVALSFVSLRWLIRPPYREWSTSSDRRRGRRRVQQAPPTLYDETQWDHYGRCRLSVCARQRDPGYAALSASVAIGRPCAPGQARTMPASCALPGHDELSP